MANATHIKDLAGWAGHAALYRIDPPISHEDRLIDLVIISGSNKPPGPPQVAVFEASEDGEPVNIGDTVAKLDGTTSHIDMLRALECIH